MKSSKYLYSFFSNHLDVLSYLLNHHLFTTKSQPFDRRWIIVPNSTLKYWLKNNLTILNKHSLSMGSSIVSLEEFFKEIFHFFPLNDKTKKIFSKDSLLPYLYKELKHFSLSDLTQNSSPNTSDLSYSNIISLISLFKKYYFYHVNTSNQNRLIDLWNKVKTNFYSIKEILSISLEALSKNLFSCSFFLFCPEYLPDHFLSFLNDLSSLYKVFTFHLSPCEEFWGDVISDQQISYIQTKFKQSKVNKKEIKEWLLLVTDRNPLLANLGQLEKKCFNQIETLDPIFIDKYIFPKATHNLAKIQKEILKLSLPSNPTKDNSISIHICNNVRREVEVLFNNITELIAKKNPCLNEIFIGVPNTALYEPYLSAIFQKIPINIIGKKDFFTSILSEKVLLIRDIFKNNLCFNSIFSLFSHKDFLNHMKLDEQDAQFLISWLKTHPFFYNKDKKLNWKLSLNNLINGYPSFNYDKNYFELIGKINLWLTHLQESLDNINTLPQKTLNIWFSVIYENLNSLFLISEEEKLILTSLEKNFSDLTNLIKDNPPLFDFDFFFDCLIDKISSKKEEIKHPFIKNTIHCGLLKDFSLFPKKFFFILGMHLKSYTEPLSTEELEFAQIPSELEIENQSILNSIITTQEKLTISYVSDSINQTPPIFGVDQIKKYIDKEKIIIHPNKNYSYKYFSKTFSNLQLNSIHKDLSYLYSLSSKNPLKSIKAPDFFSQNNSFTKNFFLKKKITSSITIKSLLFSLNNPLFHFLSNQFNQFSTKHQLSYFKPRFFVTEKEKKFFLTHLLEPKDSFFEEQKLFLSPYFLTLAEEEKYRLFSTSQNYLNHPELQQITFSNNCNQFTYSKNVLLFPPMHIKINEISLSITGTIFGIIEDSLIILDDLNLNSMIQALPSIALLKQLEKETNKISPIKKIKFLSETINTEDFQDNYLIHMLDYYLLSQEKPSPLLIEWLPHILNLEEEKLQQAIHATIKKSKSNHFLSSIFSYREPPNSKNILETWGHCAKLLFPMWEKIK